jgi:hypothetical protein
VLLLLLLLLLLGRVTLGIAASVFVMLIGAVLAAQHDVEFNAGQARGLLTRRARTFLAPACGCVPRCVIDTLFLTAAGYFWMGTNCCSTAAYVLYMNGKSKSVNLTSACAPWAPRALMPTCL